MTLNGGLEAPITPPPTPRQTMGSTPGAGSLSPQISNERTREQQSGPTPLDHETDAAAREDAQAAKRAEVTAGATLDQALHTAESVSGEPEASAEVFRNGLANLSEDGTLDSDLRDSAAKTPDQHESSDDSSQRAVPSLVTEGTASTSTAALPTEVHDPNVPTDTDASAVSRAALDSTQAEDANGTNQAASSAATPPPQPDPGAGGENDGSNNPADGSPSRGAQPPEGHDQSGASVAPEASAGAPPRMPPEQNPAVPNRTDAEQTIPGRTGGSHEAQVSITVAKPTEQSRAEVEAKAEAYQNKAKTKLDDIRERVGKGEQITPAERQFLDQYTAEQNSALPATDRAALEAESASLKPKIDKAKDEGQMTMAKVLEDRQARIDGIIEAANEQARAALAGKNREAGDLLDGADAQVMQQEAAAKVAYGQEYREAEKAKTEDIDRLAKEADKAKSKKRDYMADFHEKEIRLLQEIAQGEAIGALIKRSETEQDPSKKEAFKKVGDLIDAINKEQNADKKKALQEEFDKRFALHASLKDNDLVTAYQRVLFNRERLSLYRDNKRRKEIEEAAKQLDEAELLHLDVEYTRILKNRLQGLYARIDNIDAESNVLKRIPLDERNKNEAIKARLDHLENKAVDEWNTEYKIGSDPDNLKACKDALKKKIAPKAKNWKHAREDYKAALKTGDAAGIKKAREEYRFARRAMMGECLKSGGMGYLWMNVALLYLFVWGSMKLMEMMYQPKG